MTIEEIIRGESKNTEFKEELPKKSEKYTKTVVAYANTQGGKLVFGVVDETREVVGIDEAILFQTMDSIANAISDSCEPQIIPEIEPNTVEGKTVIVVTIHPEPQRPYYLKSQGKDKGTYIRVGGTTRPAHPVKIKELEMEGMRISWDELTCVGYKVTDDAVEELCKTIEHYRKEADLPKRRVNLTQLVNWKLLKETDGDLLASNAFALMTSEYFPFSKTQCAVFKGTERSIFLDKREYTGPLYKQIDEAMKFVLRNIRLGAKVHGLLRRESYELPVEAIREMIVNAHCHRNMTDESCVQVAIYDDRLEVTSPGGLYNGLTFEDMMQGHSRLRNRAVANIFSQMGLVESWGTGIKKIKDLAAEYGLPEPEFIEAPETFRVNLYRKGTEKDTEKSTETSIETRNTGTVIKHYGSKTGEKTDTNTINDMKEGIEKGTKTELGTEKGIEIGDINQKILEIIAQNPNVTIKEIAEATDTSVKRVRNALDKMRTSGKIIREGAQKNGKWVIRQ